MTRQEEIKKINKKQNDKKQTTAFDDVKLKGLEVLVSPNESKCEIMRKKMTLKTNSWKPVRIYVRASM